MIANTELKIKYHKIRLIDEKIKDADYGVKRRRGRLNTLQKMDENRTERELGVRIIIREKLTFIRM